MRSSKLLLFVAAAILLAAGVSVVRAEHPTEAELWPVQLTLQECVRGKGKPQANVLAWTPPGAKRIRAMLIIVANSDSKHFGEHAPVRKIAAKHKMAIVYLRCGQVIDSLQNVGKQGARPLIHTILDALAKETGIQQFRHAPWIPFGKSSVGRFPFWMAWAYPKRTIAAITYHGETPTWPPADWARLKDETIPYVCMNGETEWGGTWNRHVRPSLLNYRANTAWLAHQAIARGVGHGNYPDTHGSKDWGRKFPGQVTCLDVWNYLALFVDKALSARLPKGKYPTEGPIELKQLKEADGVLVAKFAIERAMNIPRHKLVRKDGAYVVDPGGDDGATGFAAIAPAAGLAPGEGVPVVELTPGKCPPEWIATAPLNFPMRNDPMTALGKLAELRPAVGDKATIDKETTTFSKLPEKFVDRRGKGIRMKGALQKRGNVSMLLYTVLKIGQKGQYKLDAPYTQNGRVQVVLNGELVAHRQVIELDKGLYPMLVAVRLRTEWNNLSVALQPATEAEVTKAKEVAAETAKREADQKNKPEGPEKPEPKLIQKASEVAPAERKDRFWLPDMEMAEAWLKLHMK